VVERNQSVGNKRHHLPSDQEKECFGGGKDNGQAKKQEVEQETEEADVLLPSNSFRWPNE